MLKYQSILLALAMLSALIASFWLTLALLDEQTTIAHTRTNFVIRMGASLRGGQGWSTPTGTLRHLSAPRATLELPLRGVSANKLKLLFMFELERYRSPPTLTVKYNGNVIGTITPQKRSGRQRVEMHVPVHLAYQYFPPILAIETNSTNRANVKFRLIGGDNEATRRAAKGFVDSCSRKSVSGWASDSLGPVQVRIQVSGQQWPGVALASVKRPDLKSVGVSTEAGFRATWRKPVPVGSKIEVLVDGMNLNGSPCEVLR